MSLPPPLLEDQDEILWSELMKFVESFIEDWNDESQDHQRATALQELPRKETKEEQMCTKNL